MAVHQFTTWQELYKLKCQFLITLFTPEEIRNEEWRPVVGFEHLYSVSNLGRIRGDTTTTNGKYKAGRILNPYLSKQSKYYYVVLCRDGKRKNKTLHTVVAAAFLGKTPQGKSINHKDGIKLNNRSDNFDFRTPKEQTHHAMEMGLMRPARGKKNGWYTHPEVPRASYGEKNGHAKLKNADIPDIFELRKEGKSQQAIGNIYGVSQAVVSSILRGKTWRTIANLT